MTGRGREPEDRLNEGQIETYVAFTEIASQLRFRLETHLRTTSQLSHVQFEILGKLMRTPGQRLRMTDLADGIVVSRSGLTYQVGVLARQGLVERLPSPDDERSTLVELTDAGRSQFLELLPGHVQIVRELLVDALSADEAAALRATLTHVRDRMRSLSPRSAHRG